MSDVTIVKAGKRTEKLAEKAGHGMQELQLKPAKREKTVREYVQDLHEFFTRNPDDSMQAMLEPDWGNTKASDPGQKSLTKGFK